MTAQREGYAMSLTRRTLIGASLAVSVLPQAHAAVPVLRIGISTSLNTLDPLLTYDWRRIHLRQPRVQRSDAHA